MRRVARIAVALVLAAFAVPVLACGFEKTTTTTMAAPASTPAVAKADPAKRAKATPSAKTPKVRASAAQKVAATN